MTRDVPFEQLAARVDTSAAWDNLVVDPDALRRLREIADQVRARSTAHKDWPFEQPGNGRTGARRPVLFEGPAGAHMVAGAALIAGSLGLDLYRVDLSAVVSKYIGETEKNLRRLFDAAAEGGAILLFDEADALFGRRSEVRDSHDRYANIEINYLLERIESFPGIVILATNATDDLPEKVLRLGWPIVRFAKPDPAE